MPIGYFHGKKLISSISALFSCYMFSRPCYMFACVVYGTTAIATIHELDG